MKECPQTKRSLKTQTLTWTRRGKITGVTHGNGNVLRDIHRGEHNDNLSVILTPSYFDLWFVPGEWFWIGRSLTCCRMGYLGAILVHPVRRQNFAGKLPIWFYNIWDCEIYHHLCKNGIVCLWGMHVSGVKGNGALYFGATVIHGQPRGDDDGDPQYSRWQR